MRQRKGAVVKVVITDGIAELDVSFFAPKPFMEKSIKARLTPGRRALFAGQVGSFRGRRQLSHPETQVLESPDDRATVTARVGAGRGVRRHDPADLPGRREAHHLEDRPGGAHPARRPRAAGAGRPGAAGGPGAPRPDAAGRRAAGAAPADLAGGGRSRPRPGCGTRRRSCCRWRWPGGGPRWPPSRRSPRPGREGGLLGGVRRAAAVPAHRGPGRRSSAAIADDLRQSHPMHRLLQGEVGSGKTVVALRAMLTVVDAGRPGRAARSDRGPGPAAPPLDHPDDGRPGRGRDARRPRATAPGSGCSPAASPRRPASRRCSTPRPATPGS